MQELDVVIGENANTITFKKNGQEIIVKDDEFFHLMEIFLAIKESIAED